MKCPHCGKDVERMKDMKLVLRRLPGQGIFTLKTFRKLAKYGTQSAAVAMCNKLRGLGYIEVIDRAHDLIGSPMLLAMTPEGRSYRAPNAKEFTP